MKNMFMKDAKKLNISTKSSKCKNKIYLPSKYSKKEKNVKVQQKIYIKTDIFVVL